MKYPIGNLTKCIAIILALIILNLTVIPNFEHAMATSLTSENMQPELHQYWKYENKDVVTGWVFHFTLEFVAEKTIRVANKDVQVNVLEGSGSIEGWPSGVQPGYNEIYIKKEIKKNNLETVTYTQQINYTTNYNKINITYDIAENTKPNNITIGSQWTKKVNRTKVIETKNEGEPLRKDEPIIELINSTLECDRIDRVTTPAGEFDAFRIIEQQYILDFPDTTIFWYLSVATKSVVKMERKSVASEIVETEQLLDFGKKVIPNNNHENGNDIDDNNDTEFFDLNNPEFQILLGITILVVIAIIIGAISFRKKKREIDE
jgi:hypothetical protein